LTKTDFSNLEAKTIDLQALLVEKYGRLKGMSLDNLGEHTLGIKTIGNSRLMPAYWRKGKYEKVMEHCRRDVSIVRGLFLHALRDKYLCFYSPYEQEVVTLEIDISFQLK
jgi:hypothetical protein